MHIGSANCTLDVYNYRNESGIETVELRFNGVPCNLSLNTTKPVAQCLKKTEVVNESEQTLHYNTCNVQSSELIYNTIQVAYLIRVVFHLLLLLCAEIKQ